MSRKKYHFRIFFQKNFSEGGSQINPNPKVVTVDRVKSLVLISTLAGIDGKLA
jgi:hypothetical protein